MDSRNLFILVVYCISVAYVIYRMIKEIDKLVVIELNRDLLAQQLEAQELQGLVDIKFKFEEQYQLEDLQKLQLSIDNKSPDYSLYVNWDQSALIDFEGRSRRVIRLPPGMTLDLLQPQVFSVIAPSQSLRETLTAEDVLKRDASGTLAITSPLFKPRKLKRAADKTDYISLRLSLQFPDPTAPTVGRRFYDLSCQLILTKPTWQSAIVEAWKPKRK
jgi:hypothetical protein